jgi:hypothetical protein
MTHIEHCNSYITRIDFRKPSITLNLFGNKDLTKTTQNGVAQSDVVELTFLRRHCLRTSACVHVYVYVCVCVCVCVYVLFTP